MIRDGIYTKANLLPSPNKGGRIKPRLIVVHDTAGGLDASGSISWLCNPSARVSAHFVIARDGKVTQLVSCNLRAWHAGQSIYGGVANVNDFSIGIEIVNPGAMAESGTSSAQLPTGKFIDRKAYKIEERGEQWAVIDGKRTLTHPAALWMPYTEAQITAVLDLCMALKDAYGISEVAPHWFISPGRKKDTNPLFPLAWLQARIAGRYTEPPVEAPAPKPVAPDPLAVPSIWVRLNDEGIVRQWPSFYASNIIHTDDVPLKVLGKAGYFIEGEEVPESLKTLKLPWYRVELPDQTAQVGFVLEQHALIET